MVIRERMMTSIKRNFNKFGGQLMESPVFELRSILMDKYGEDEQLIYDLAEQEAEVLSMRYDLTVPLARFVAQNRKELRSPLKAARCGRVYRRDQPYMTKGRLREFWQCDFDIIRVADTAWMADAENRADLVLDDMEIIALMIANLRDLLEPVFAKGQRPFIVRLNNRKLLDAILAVCSVPSDKVRAISSAIDKLDKKDWECVREEMVEKGIDAQSADKIRTFTAIRGPPGEVLEQLKTLPALQSEEAKSAIAEFESLLAFLDAYDSELMGYLEIDMSMVRGLDYYTGIILEAQFADKTTASQFGSIAGGGRYDRLVSRFVTSSSEQYPCVGASVGFERIFSFLKETQGIGVGVSSDVLICALGDDVPTAERLKLLRLLRTETRLNAEIENRRAPKFRDQINYAEQREIRWMVIVGGDELKKGTVNLRRLTLKGDIIVTKDGKRGEILGVVQKDGQKWPQFRVRASDAKYKNKEWLLNKKQIKGVVQNGIELELQTKDLPRAELVAFFDKLYP